MTFSRWVAHVVRSTFALLFNLAVVTGLFLLSAHLRGQPDEEPRNIGWLVQVVASFWLYIAAWTWLVRGVFQRPAKPVERGKPTGAAVFRSTLGCLANLVPIPFVFVLGGRAADWAWAGLRGADATHPARQVADRLLAWATFALDTSGVWLPWAVGGVVLYNVARAVRRAARAASGDPKRGQVQQGKKAIPGKPKQPGQRPTRSKDRFGPREILAPAGAAGAAAIGAAHAGAHGAEPARFTPGSAREDRVLGALSFSSADRAWWAHREEGAFPLRIEGGPDGPDPHALDLARQAAQRSFEVLLRASEAARVVAQKRGVGLPRFTISAVRVGAGSTPDVSLHLHCDADAGHEYLVRSADKLQTFTATSPP